MYGKIFAQMYEGTLASKGPWEALVTFQQLVVLANKHGEIDMTPEAIANRTTIPLKIIRKGIAVLELPDPDSRTPDEEGRRILRLNAHRSWGWRLVNYEKYRRIRSEEERREYQANWVAAKRSKTKENLSTSVDNVDPCSKQYAVSSVQEKSNPAPETGAGANAPLLLSPEDEVVPIRTWFAFVEMRKKIRKPLTDHAGELIRRKLYELKEQGHDPVECLENSIRSSWADVFAPDRQKEGRRGTHSDRKSAIEITLDGHQQLEAHVNR